MWRVEAGCNELSATRKQFEAFGGAGSGRLQQATTRLIVTENHGVGGSIPPLGTTIFPNKSETYDR
jgi:hypothetical protein